ncbi:MAG: AAA family ATPase [Polyangiaceae bacterium]
MRPTKLKIEGFTCFREATTIVLAGLDVFAIAGPTGAGKTSILDAMVFALYGKVPRVGKACGDLISLGRDRLSITFEFDLQGRSFVLTRTLRRKGGGTVQLDEGQTALAEGANAVNAKIEQLVGMPYETFTQAVVLPQGEFAAFLSSTGAERTRILRGLLRFEVYERMRKMAGQEEAVAAQAISLVQAQLDEHAQTTSESVAQLESSLGTCRIENQNRENTIREKESVLETLRGLRDKTKELEATISERDQVNQSESQIAASRTELDASERALQIEAVLADADSKTRENASCQAAVLSARENVKSVTKLREEHHAAKKEAEHEAEQVPSLRDRVQSLDKIVGYIEARDEKRKDRAALEATLASATKEVATQRKAFPRLETQARDTLTKLNAAKAHLSGTDYDPKRTKQLEAARKDAERLADLRREAKVESSKLSKLEKNLALKQREVEQLRDAVEAAKKDETVAITAREKLEQALTTGELVDHVRALHETLAIGEQCPVCDQKVKVIPKKPRTRERDDLEDKLETAEKEEKRKAEARAKSETRLDGANSDLTGVSKELREAKKEAERLEDATTALETQLEKKIGDMIANQKAGLIEIRLAAEIDAATMAREAREEARNAEAEAKDAEAMARENLQKAKAAIGAFDEKISDFNRRLEKSRNEIETWTSKIADVTEHPDPASERKEIAARADSLDRAVRTATENAQRTDSEFAAASAALKISNERATLAAAAAENANRNADKAARTQKFEDAVHARAGLRDEPIRKRLRTQVAQFDDKRRALIDRIAVLERELGGRRVPADEFDRADEELRTTKNADREARKTEGVLFQQLETARKTLVQAEKLRGDVAKRSAERALYAQLAKDLGASEFQEFMLRGTVNELVARASERLMRLSGERFALVVRDDDFHVVDHNNAGEERPATTLSGGETFLTSLALALELSEQVQRAAGAVHLDSLFVDEGFGTLDPEALNVAADAILSLQTDGRMVGVITHGPELTRLVPMRMIVQKGASSAVVQIEKD